MKINATYLRKSFATSVFMSATLLAGAASAGEIYSNGFETDTAGWFSPTRVASGTGGIASSSGSFHALANTDYTTFGGYNFGAGNVATPFQAFSTTLDIYLNLEGGWANNTRFDYGSAISNAATGLHLRDFIFNAGYYNDATGPGAGTQRFVISASNNTQPGSAYAKNPGRNPITISSSGWYTFQHTFYDNGGVLGVDMSILDASDTLVNTWTLGGDAIGTAGGSRYGWMDYNQFGTLAIDNSAMSTADAEVPEPGSLALLGLGLLGFSLTRRKQK